MPPVRLVIAVLKHETSCFSPVATGIERFGESGPSYGEDVVRDYGRTRTPIAAFLDYARRVGAEVVTPIGAHAKPSAPVTGDVFEQLVAPIVEAARRGCDAMLLDLHGAMVAETFASGEVELLRRLREVLPDEPIGVALDLHANLPDAIVDLATVISGYKTFPHVDMYETGVAVADAIDRVLAGSSRPVMALARGRMLTDAKMTWTEAGAMQTLVEAAAEAERHPAVISATIFPGFALSDVPAAGLSVLVVTEGDRALARETADRLVDLAWRHRADFTCVPEPLEQSVRRAKELTSGPVLLIDYADNTSSGGTQDTMRVVAEVMRQGLEDVAVAAIKDPEAVDIMVRAGVGATVTLPLGGKVDMPSIGLKGEPLEVTGVVRTITDGQFTVTGPFYNGVRTFMGRTVVLDTGRIQLVVTERNVEPWDVGVFTSVGIVPERKRYLLLKSRVAYRAAFQSMATEIVECCGVGVTTSDMSVFDFRRVERPVYPLDALNDWRRTP